MLIIRRLNCIDTASGIVLSVSGRPVHLCTGRLITRCQCHLVFFFFRSYNFVSVTVCYVFGMGCNVAQISISYGHKCVQIQIICLLTLRVRCVNYNKSVRSHFQIS